MTDIGLETRSDTLVVRWAKNDSTEYPSIWLRDNCPSGFHPQTEERTFDLLSLEGAPQLLAATQEDDRIMLSYADGHVSAMPIALLNDHRPGRAASDPAAIAAQPWRADLGADGVPRYAAAEILESDAKLQAWMQQTLQYGLSVVEGLPADADAGIAIAERIGFLRQTNFGTTFEVVNRPDPNNLAFTALALPLHTDLANQEVPPGFQFLHCLANEAEGGGSVFADGYALAEELRRKSPDDFDLLCSVPIPFRFHDAAADIRVHRPVITLDARGNTVEIRYNAHLVGIFDMPVEQMVSYYRAYRAFMALTRDPAFRLPFKLRQGEMVIFDNRRVLHGREAFDPSSGFRHLRGCYVDRGEFESRLRLLARAGS